MQITRVALILSLLCANVSFGESKNYTPLQKAYQAWLEGEFKRAVRLYENACASDDMGGCHALGTLYFQGSGVSQNYSVSASYYFKACNGGFAQSCSSLGVLYHYGLGVRQDYDIALNLYHRSCESGYARGCNNLGVMFEEGLGVRRDFKDRKSVV